MTPETLDAAAIREVVALTEKTRKLEIVTVDNIGAIPGVPDKITIGIRTGERPEVVGLSAAFEDYREHPRRKTGSAVALSLDSFIGLTMRHKTADTVIFAKTEWRAPSLTAVIDYHRRNGDTKTGSTQVGTAGWLKHRMHYAYPLSDDWKVWVEKNGEAFDQAKFASFIEDRIADLTSPTAEEREWLESDFETKVATPSDLLRLSRGLQVNIESKVKNIVSLQSGAAQIQFEEVHSDSDGQPLTVPGIFLLQIAPFAAGGRIRLPVRLRYRKQGGAIVWFYQMYRPDQFITDRLREDIRLVSEATELPIFEGTPEA